MGAVQLYAYDETNKSHVKRNIRPPTGFSAPGYIWKPAHNNKPGENVLVCCVFDEKDRSCCF